MASAFTMFSMLKIWMSAFWAEPEGVQVSSNDSRWRSMTWIVGGMAMVSLAIGLGAEGVLQVATQAAESVLDQTGYMRLVFDAGGKGND